MDIFMDMSYWLIILPIAVVGFLFIGWKEKQPLKTTEKLKNGNVVYRSLSPEDGWAMLKDTRSVTIADVRTSEEFNDTHIPGSVNLSVMDLNAASSSRLGKRNKTILVYCQSGTRSKNATKLLYRYGFTNVYDIGGMAAFYKNKPQDQ